VVFLSDGLPTSGLTNGEEIGSSLARVNSAAAARLHVFGVGYDVNTLLLDQLAADSRGTVTYVRPGRNLESVLTDFYGKVADPVMTDLEVEFQGMEVGDLYPPVLPDLFRGSGLLLAGRYHATKGPVSVRVRGWASGEYHEYVYHFDLDRLPNRGFVPRLWATRHVGALLDQVRTQGWSQPLEDEIRELGLSYGVVTPYTEFAIDGQATGAASTESMALYGAAALNEASGRVTVEARLQNQAYQQAAQASLAQGANLITSGQYSLAEVGSHQVDLSLLKGRQGIEGRITDEWLAENLRPDRIVEFGSEEYFGLASDPKVRPFLLGGRAVIFSHQGEVIVIRDREDESPDVDGSQVTRRAGEAPQGIMLNHAKVVALWMALPWAVRAMVLLGVPWILFWLLLGVAILGYTAKRSRI
jgi:Ca-activated chloride channel family protein